jgi:hypothetical protein
VKGEQLGEAVIYIVSLALAGRCAGFNRHKTFGHNAVFIVLKQAGMLHAPTEVSAKTG